MTDVPLEALPHATLVLGAGGALLAINGRARALLELDESAPLPNLSDLVQEPSGDVDALLAAWRTSSSPTPAPLTLVPEHSGERLWCIGVPILPWRGDGTDRVLVQIRPGRRGWTERRRSVTSPDEARSAALVREQTLSIVAHDLRNTLHALSLAAGLLEADLPDGLRDQQVSHVRRLAGDLNTLLADLVDAARLEAGAIRLKRSPTDLVPIVQAIVGSMRSVASLHGVALGFEGGAEPVVGDVDPGQVTRVIRKLLERAIRVTPDGGRVEIGLSRQGDEVECYVRDRGPVIDPEAVPELFGTFWHSRWLGHAPAALGMAIARGVVEAHEGGIRVEAPEGGGSEFRFTLPAAS